MGELANNANSAKLATHCLFQPNTYLVATHKQLNSFPPTFLKSMTYGRD